MAKQITKKEIRNKIQDSVHNALGELRIKKPSKKVRKVIKKASSKIAGKVSRKARKVLLPQARKKSGSNGQPGKKKSVSASRKIPAKA